MALNLREKPCRHCGLIFMPTGLAHVYCSPKCMVMFGATFDSNGCLICRFGGDKDGYGLVKLPGMKVKIGAHRVSYTENIGPIPRGMLVCHSCDNPPCILQDHLFLGTPADNKADSVKKRRHAFGQFNRNAKLTPEQVSIIVNARGSQRTLAERFSISVATVQDIKSGRSWQCLDDPRV